MEALATATTTATATAPASAVGPGPGVAPTSAPARHRLWLRRGDAQDASRWDGGRGAKTGPVRAATPRRGAVRRRVEEAEGDFFLLFFWPGFCLFFLFNRGGVGRSHRLASVALGLEARTRGRPGGGYCYGNSRNESWKLYMHRDMRGGVP